MKATYKVRRATRRELPSCERAPGDAIALGPRGIIMATLYDAETVWTNIAGVKVEMEDQYCLGTGVMKTILVGSILDAKPYFFDIIQSSGQSYRAKSISERRDVLQNALRVLGDIFCAIEPPRIDRGYIPAFDRICKEGGAGIIVLREDEKYPIFFENMEK